MAKEKIIYTICSHGEDGRGREYVEFASFSKKERNKAYSSLKSPGFYTKIDKTVNMSKEKAKKRISKIDRLILGIKLKGEK